MLLRSRFGVSNMKRILGLGVLAAILFVALTAVETYRSEEAFSAVAFALDLIETAILVLAVAITAYVAMETREIRRERAGLLDDLARARADGEKWRAAARGHIDGLSRAIRDQFGAWHLSASEADVAILLLKGLSHREIARLRNTSSATVRQQAASVYRKSGLTSRADLSAFFLEDLLAPASRPPGDVARPQVALIRSKD